MASAAVLPLARPPPPDMDLDLDDERADELDEMLAQVDEKSIELQDSTSFPSMMAYYRHLLPWRVLFSWLNRDSAHLPSNTNFTHREFAFTLQNDAYLRYNSYSTWEELKRDVIRLNPSRFEIGPVYSAKPKDRKTVRKTSFKPVARELVFDIDMTDYDGIRTCCSGKGICKRCWAFIAVAVEILDSSLRDDFGFEQLLWVYSGRRGIHCWVSDKGAFELADDARRAMMGWLEVIKGGAQQAKKVDLGASKASGRSLHPALRRAIGTDSEPGPLRRAFADTVLVDQDCFAEEKGWRTLLALLPSTEDEALTKLRNKWESSPGRSSTSKWRDVMEAASKKGDINRRTVWMPALEDIVLQYTYPRIDAEVSKHMNHLLKSPFVIHPATGRVCVPLDVDKVASFDPEEDCPTVAKLLRELNAADAAAAGAAQQRDSDWQKTSLKPFVDVFEKHCAKIAKATRDAKRAAGDNSMDF